MQLTPNCYGKEIALPCGSPPPPACLVFSAGAAEMKRFHCAWNGLETNKRGWYFDLVSQYFLSLAETWTLYGR